MDSVIKNDNMQGNLHLITGPMYSGKSTKLIETYNNLLKCDDCVCSQVVVVTHTLETRYSYDKLSSHDRKELECIKVEDIQTIINACSNTISNKIQHAKYIMIDEAQFFPDLKKVIELVEKFNKSVFIYGLDCDFKRNKFGSILDLVPYCNTVQKLSGKCSYCDNKSHFSWRISNDKTTQIIVGSAEEYIALCRLCYLKASI